MADNFTPGETIPVNATTAGASASFSLAQSANYPDCLVVNTGTVPAFVGFGAAANVPAPGATNGVPIQPGDSVILRKGIGVSQCSAITLTGNATLYFTAGEGN